MILGQDYEGTPSARLCRDEQITLWQIEMILDGLIGHVPEAESNKLEKIIGEISEVARYLP